MLARTDALMSQAETGKIALRPSSPLRPVVTRNVQEITARQVKGSQGIRRRHWRETAELTGL
jgi:hypothetical protein